MKPNECCCNFSFSYISDLNDIPGYTPITKTTPVWKRDMIEKKNQEKIDEYIVSRGKHVCII